MDNLCRKRLIVIVFSVIFSLSLVSQIYAATINLNAVKQLQSSWCWVASSVSILNTKGVNPAQCAFFKQAKGTTSCPNEAGSAIDAQNGMKKYGVSSTYYDGNLTWTNLKAQIDKKSPVYVSWGWRNGGGHAVVSHGYGTVNSTNYVYYMDPWDGIKTSMTYTAFVGGSSSDRTWRWGLKDF